MKRVIGFIIILLMLGNISAFAAGPGQRGGMSASVDPELQAVLDENSTKFEQRTFTDPDTGYELEYSLYIPESYDGTNSFPLIMFIPDATGAGKSAEEIVRQYYGATIWITDEDQAKHPSFVLVPAFSEVVVNDNWQVSDQVETAVKLLDSLKQEYRIDRMYTTGQSMGCMTSLYLNGKYPGLFTASLFVSGQWDISALQPLEGAKFFYITAGGDAKASGGQTEVMAMLDADNIPYSYGEWNAQNSEEEQNAAVGEMLKQGNAINMVRFETGTVFKEGQSGMEHMASFNYAYRIQAVRDWLFEQFEAEGEDDTAAYADIIDEYRAAYETGNSANLEYLFGHNLSEVCAYSSGVGYALLDIDQNGVPELIIAGMGTNDFSNGIIYGMYTLVEGSPVNVFTSMARMRYYLCTDNTVYWEGSGGAAYSYFVAQHLNGSSLENAEAIFTNPDGDEGQWEIGYYYQQGPFDLSQLPDENSVKLSAEEFNSRIQEMESRIYVPELMKII